MSEYLINKNTLSILANNARRIANVNYKMNNAEILEIMSRTQGTIKTDGKYEVKAISHSGEILKSGTYNTGEIFALPNYVPDFVVNGQNGPETIATFKCWSATAPVTSGYITVEDMPIIAGAIMEPVDDLLYICIETTEENTAVSIHLSMKTGTFIDLGDGSTKTTEQYDGYINHVYATPGNYIIKVSHCNDYNRAMSMSLGADSTTKKIIKHVCIPSWVGEYYEGCFQLRNLETVILSEGIVCGIDVNNNDMTWRRGFAGCDSLSTVVFPPSFVDLGGYMFDRDYSFNNTCMNTIVLPYGVETIPEGFCRGCPNLMNISIPNTVKIIEASAFEGSAFDKLIIPNSVTTIGSRAFYRDPYKNTLNTLIVLTDYVLPIPNDAFTDTTNLAYGVYNIYVPDNLVDSYKADTVWNTCAVQIKPLSEYAEG